MLLFSIPFVTSRRTITRAPPPTPPAVGLLEAFPSSHLPAHVFGSCRKQGAAGGSSRDTDSPSSHQARLTQKCQSAVLSRTTRAISSPQIPTRNQCDMRGNSDSTARTQSIPNAWLSPGGLHMSIWSQHLQLRAIPQSSHLCAKNPQVDAVPTLRLDHKLCLLEQLGYLCHG